MYHVSSVVYVHTHTDKTHPGHIDRSVLYPNLCHCRFYCDVLCLLLILARLHQVYTFIAETFINRRLINSDVRYRQVLN